MQGTHTHKTQRNTHTHTHTHIHDEYERRQDFSFLGGTRALTASAALY